MKDRPLTACPSYSRFQSRSNLGRSRLLYKKLVKRNTRFVSLFLLKIGYPVGNVRHHFTRGLPFCSRVAVHGLPFSLVSLFDHLDLVHTFNPTDPNRLLLFRSF